MTNHKHHKNMTNITLDNIDSFITPKSVDTLMVSKFFKQLGFSDDQSEAFSEIVKKTNVNAEQIANEKITTYEEKNKSNLTELASKKDVGELEFKIEKIRSDLELKIETIKFDLIKWVAGLMLAQVGLVFALIKFFTNF